ncbi:heterokaryon incompatibility protein-domain-containing protein [Trametes polyzona]|nr:heterokaryon incompatibility protein-domain-containing protein [Trametes polyzona]
MVTALPDQICAFHRMRCLDTTTGEFVWLSRPSKEHYAILSHTWTTKEQLYTDLLRLQEAMLQPRGMAAAAEASESGSSACTKYSILDDPRLSEKIRGACKIAREAGYKYIWIDACCIDKSNSAESSEAINSMFEWYRLADVCYVYLQDVPGAAPEAFRRSRWHRRGWTLQEMIAPEHVVFYTQDWEFLGTRSGLATELEEITRVDFDVLTGIAPLSSVSVARRMSWAARRETTRIEDRAYSLLGIFGVHMSPIYGEGHNAFLRLQEKIIRTIPDQSIFAWGPSSDVLRPADNSSWWVEPDTQCLLASSPSAFEYSADVSPLSASDFLSILQLEPKLQEQYVAPLHCLITPHGVRMRLLCLDDIAIRDALPTTFESIARTRLTWTGGCKECAGGPNITRLALLRCRFGSGRLVALPLCLPEQEPYTVAPFMSCPHWLHKAPFRTLSIDGGMIGRVLAETRASEVSGIPTKSSHIQKLLLLRHTQRLAPPKSNHVQEESAISLWPSRGREGIHGGLTFHLEPRTREELRALGFSISEPRCELSAPDQMLLTTTVDQGNSSTLRASGTLLQRIYIRLTLSQIPVSHRSGDLDTLARFSIENTFRAADTSGSSVDNEELVPSLNDIEAPCADDSEETSVSEFSSRTSAQRILVEATFVIHADTDWAEDTFGLRRLRLRLERPWGHAPAAGDLNGRTPATSAVEDLLLSVELSACFRRRRERGLVWTPSS